MLGFTIWRKNSPYAVMCVSVAKEIENNQVQSSWWEHVIQSKKKQMGDKA